MLQVDTEGDALLACDTSLSGEAILFAGSGGYLHLWSSIPEPRINLVVEHVRSGI